MFFKNTVECSVTYFLKLGFKLKVKITWIKNDNVRPSNIL